MLTWAVSYFVEVAKVSSDDYAPTFSGDETGDIFAAPDVVQLSEITTERVVDTQSGFLVVIRRVDSRLALSVKRRLGTPPVSSILLTPDESVKLSKILAGSQFDSYVPTRLNTSISPEVDSWLADINDHDASALLDEPGQTQRDPHSRTFTAKRPRTRRRNTRPPLFSKTQLVVAAACVVVTPIVLFAVYKTLTPANKVAAAAPPAINIEQVQSQRINTFARNFVSDMLDFNPRTYKVSQIHAMASMSPELMERYWQETHFPLSQTQLNATPQGMTLMITKIDQKKLANKSSDVDLFAELVSADSKISNPVHLKLTVAGTDDGQLRVLDQKDLSAKK